MWGRSVLHFLSILLFLLVVIGPIVAYAIYKDRLFHAVSAGRIDTVERILREKPDVAERSDAIVWAVMFGRLEVCELLILHRCDVRRRSAALLLEASNRPEILRFLLEKGADATALPSGGFTPLHGAAWKGCIESIAILHDHGANLDAVENPGKTTPLEYAARSGQIEAVELLLSLGANPNAVNVSNGLTGFRGSRVDAERLKACEELIGNAQRYGSTR
jgi:ankyrin repeat protein